MPDSSVAEQVIGDSSVNHLVTGSNPVQAALFKKGLQD